ncbi:ribosome biogenesis/translation initiation ATPase RLI [archaeon]|nr:ribosome biogenesis/translation initiation ATPase RLI [archaeon]
MKRLAIIEREKCINRHGCSFVCAKYCPLNRAGKECITENQIDKKPNIDEALCNGCGICTKRCPSRCVSIINLPSTLKETPLHRYGKNMFEIYGLPMPKKGMIIGILGRNGIGKTSALSILTGQLIPNQGDFEKEALKEDIVSRYSRNILGEYFKSLYKGKIRVSYKPQRIELLPKAYKGPINGLLDSCTENKNEIRHIVSELNLPLNRDISELSGGELQKLAIAGAILKDADFYFFDEPSSFLDINMRIKCAKLIRDLASKEKAVLVVEHDLATLDFISDEIQIVYGEPACFGIFSQPKPVARGVNEFMDGFLANENVRIREYSIRFHGAGERGISRETAFAFPGMKKKLGDFMLEVNAGELHKGETLAVMGANGLGKTTFLNLLAGKLKADIIDSPFEKVKISYKTQELKTCEGTVKENLSEIKDCPGWLKQDLLEKLKLEKIMDSLVKTLSGGELQKFNVAKTLLDSAELYAFDEPSAFVDVEDRLNVAEAVRNFVIRKEVCAIVVDHDVQFVDFVGDRMLVFEGEPAEHGKVMGPLRKDEGMNRVLKMLDITYRFDKDTKRPKINKPGSQKDIEQKRKGKYYY